MGVAKVSTVTLVRAIIRLFGFGRTAVAVIGVVSLAFADVTSAPVGHGGMELICC